MVTKEIEVQEYRSRINVSGYFDLRNWAKRFDVTAGELRRAVARVGDHPKDVETYLELARAEAAERLPGDPHH